ncbi:hypothetical protein V2G26_013126 [Clonostachys chloroleuca]
MAPSMEVKHAEASVDDAVEHVREFNDDEVVKNLVKDARTASDAEHKISLMEGLRTYRKAVAWSVALSSCIIMEGYDTLLIGSFFAMPSFNRKYGEPDGKGGYTLTAPWQIGLTAGVSVGSMAGVALGGWLAGKFGYKRIIALALSMITGFIFITFFAPSLIALQIGLILCGLPWGMFQSVTVAYAAEVCPTNLRGYLTNYTNLCWIIGQIIGAGVLKGMETLDNEWSFRIPFAIQWIWPIPILVAVCFAPESPWWLVRKGRIQEAERALNNLGTSGEWFNAKATVAMMIHTNKMEIENREGTRWLDAFKGVNLRRTEIVCGIWATHALCGQKLMSYSIYFYTKTGLDPSNAFSLSLGQFAIGFAASLLSWVLLARMGRRTIILASLSAQAVLLLTIGCLGIPDASDATSWSIGTLMLVFMFIYNLTVGPGTYTIAAEIPSTRMRQKTIALGINTGYVLGASYTNVIGLYMLNSAGWNWGAKAGFFWFVHCCLCLLWAFFRLPEPKGRTYAELDMLFEQRVPARKFKTAVVDPYATQPNEVQEIISKEE